MTFTLKIKEWQWNLCEVCVTPVPDVYSTVVLCLCNMRGFRRNEYNRTPQSSAYAIDNADMSIMLPREKAGRRQIAVVPEKLTSWAAITQTNKRDQRQQQKIKTRKMFSSYLQWWWGKEMGVGRQWIWLFSLKVPIKSLQLTADNYFQLEETVLKLLKRFPAKRTNCVYLSHFQKGGKGDLGVRWGRTMETGASMHWGNSWASREWQAKRQGRWGGKESGGCWGSAPRGGGAAAQCIHAAGGGGWFSVKVFHLIILQELGT